MYDFIRVVVMDDHDLFRQGLRSLLESSGDIRVVADSCSVDGAVEAMQRTEWDLVLVDLSVQHRNGEAARDGFELLEVTRGLWPSRGTLVVTMDRSRESVERAWRKGARGYLLKTATPQELVAAVRTVASGGYFLDPLVARWVLGSEARAPQAVASPLTEREAEVLQMVARGHRNADIARQMCLTVSTVKTHLRKMFDKLGVRSRTQLLRRAREEGLLKG